MSPSFTSMISIVGLAYILLTGCARDTGGEGGAPYRITRIQDPDRMANGWMVAAHPGDFFAIGLIVRDHRVFEESVPVSAGWFVVSEKQFKSSNDLVVPVSVYLWRASNVAVGLTVHDVPRVIATSARIMRSTADHQTAQRLTIKLDDHDANALLGGERACIVSTDVP